MLYNFIVINFAPLVGLLFLFVFLVHNKKTDKKLQKFFYLLCLLEGVELIVYSMELWTASFTEPTVWRILLSAVGYAIRPILLLIILAVSDGERMTKRKLMLFSIPALVNVVAAFSAFFTDVVYSYNETNEFVRGPLGYVTHVVLMFYLVCILVVSIKKNGKSHVLESAIVLTTCLVIVLAIVLEAVFSVRSLGRTAIVLSTIAYYLYFQTRLYREGIEDYMEQTIKSQKEHLREMNIINVLAKEYVTVCYVDIEKDLVTAYRMDPYIEERYGENLRVGVSFEQVFRAYVMQDIYEEDQGFFLNLTKLQDMVSYLRENGNLSKNYRVWRNGTVLYCEMRVELVDGENGVEDMVFGFSNNDMRVRKEMVYQSTVQQEFSKVKEAKQSLAGIAELAKQLQEAIEDKLSEL